jgi:hypothetical protein
METRRCAAIYTGSFLPSAFLVQEALLANVLSDEVNRQQLHRPVGDEARISVPPAARSAAE